MINVNIGEVPSATYLPLSGGTMTGTLTTVAVTIGGAVAGGDQAFTNVGDMTFAAGSIIASGSTNGNTLLLRANDTTFITLTTGATDACTLDAITMSGTWLASGTVTLPAFTLGGAVAGGDQAFTNVGDMTFAAGSIIASGSTNGNTLLIRANDTTFITLTTGATDACTLDAITMSGTWLASGTVTFPALTFGGIVTIADSSPGIVLKARDGNQLQVRNAADTTNAGITTSQANLGDIVYELSASGAFSTQNADAATVTFKTRDTGVGYVTVARLVGAADAYFEATLGVVFIPMSQPAVPVEGRVIYNSGTDKLNFYNGAAWEVVTSA